MQTVDGDCNITTGKYNVDNLSSLQLSSLTTVNGTLSLSGYSSYYYNSKLKNLDGLSTLKNIKDVAISYNMGLTDYTGLKNALPYFNVDNWNV